MNFKEITQNEIKQIGLKRLDTAFEIVNNLFKNNDELQKGKVATEFNKHPIEFRSTLAAVYCFNHYYGISYALKKGGEYTLIFKPSEMRREVFESFFEMIVQDGCTYSVKDAMKKVNILINHWFKNCKCEATEET